MLAYNDARKITAFRNNALLPSNLLTKFLPVLPPGRLISILTCTWPRSSTLEVHECYRLSLR